MHGSFHSETVLCLPHWHTVHMTRNTAVGIWGHWFPVSYYFHKIWTRSIRPIYSMLCYGFFAVPSLYSCSCTACFGSQNTIAIKKRTYSACEDGTYSLDISRHHRKVQKTAHQASDHKESYSSWRRNWHSISEVNKGVRKNWNTLVISSAPESVCWKKNGKRRQNFVRVITERVSLVSQDMDGHVSLPPLGSPLLHSHQEQPCAGVSCGHPVNIFIFLTS